jgi:anti-sigma factor RsiW
MTPEKANDIGLLLHAYVDGELDPAHAMEVERQLASNPALARERERIEALRRTITERLPKLSAPPRLARRIEAEIARAAQPTFASRPSPRSMFSRAMGIRAMSRAPSWRALAASVMLTAFVASSATWYVVRQETGQDTGQGSGADLAASTDSVVADMVLASHIRSLRAPQPVDVPSSDRHTVKPWFNGRVSEAPRVIDLGSEGFPLMGGRIDVIGRTPVPTLVYRRRQHLISLFAVPEGKSLPAQQRTIAGYNIRTWSQNRVTYWAVSDVTPADLDAFATAFRHAAG